MSSVTAVSTICLPKGSGPEDPHPIEVVAFTCSAAETLLREALAKVTAGIYTEPSRVTLAEDLDGWLASLRKRPTTMADYRQSARVYINPRVGVHAEQAERPRDDPQGQNWTTDPHVDNRRYDYVPAGIDAHPRIITVSRG